LMRACLGVASKAPLGGVTSSALSTLETTTASRSTDTATQAAISVLDSLA
jgi:hypothetical protein